MEKNIINSKELKPNNKLKCYKKDGEYKQKDKEKISLSTQNAVRYLLEGTLRLRVCRYCLSVTGDLSELDEVVVVAVNGTLHEVTIRDMVASFHPFKVNEDKNFPNKICKECLNQTMNCYLFAQKCEQAERALRNCFDDMYEKFEKLDPLQPVKRRGKPKLRPNHNVLYTEHKNVINYAEPLINIVNITTSSVAQKEISELECQKCWQLLPNVESLLNHEKSHPKSMWYTCKLCGKSFVKRCHLRRHLRNDHSDDETPNDDMEVFKCAECGAINDTLGEHLQHIEKHKFKVMFEHLMERKLDKLCSVCMEKGSKMVNVNEVIHLHGGYPDLMGKSTVQNILNNAIPGISLDSYLGTKICDTCLDHAITSYVFIVKIQHVRNRLNTCVTLMLQQLNNSSLNIKSNIMVEISQDTILPYNKIDSIDEILADDVDDDKIEFLEDEFRIESASASESDSASNDDKDTHSIANDTDENDFLLNNPAKNVTKTYTHKRLVNGYEPRYNDGIEEKILDRICAEFLTVKKKVPCRYTCPFCNKHFISDYFLKKHILKHVFRKVQCDICLKEFKSKFYLFEHKKMVHVLKKLMFVSCNVCGRTFSSGYKLKRHEKCHKVKECVLCNKHFISQKHYDVHNQRHAMKFNMYKNREVQTCSFCEKACSNENELSLHVNKTHLQIKPYNCDMCEKQFYTECNMSSHKKLHSLLSKETCEFCLKMFKCRKDLVIHVRKHMGTKPHVCLVCRQSFYSENEMKKHMKIFHGGIFCCRLCRSVFPSQLDLKNHINVVHGSM